MFLQTTLFLFFLAILWGCSPKPSYKSVIHSEADKEVEYTTLICAYDPDQIKQRYPKNQLIHFNSSLCRIRD